MGQPVYSGDEHHQFRHGFREGFGNAMNQFSNGTHAGRGHGRSNIAASHLVTLIFLKLNLQNRSSIIITAAFSVTASTFVILSVMYGSWKLSRRIYRPHTREQKRDRCLATLLHWAMLWSDIGLALTISLIVLMVVNGTILSMRLRRTAQLDVKDRIATSSIVYYLAGTAILFTLVLPFWVQGAFLQRASSSSLVMGSIALNLFGVVYAFIYLLLRANGRNMMIGPGDSAWSKDLSNGFGSTELALATQVNQPIVAEKWHESYLEKTNHLSSDEDDLKDEQRPKTRSLKRLPFNPISIPHPPALHSRKPSSYSLFPTRDSPRITKPSVLNFHDSRDDMLAPPRPSYIRHRRFSSEVSAATVQIGLRLSNIAMPAHFQSHNSSTISLGISPTPTEETSIYPSAENHTPRSSRFKDSHMNLKPLANLLTTPSISRSGGYLNRISPLRQNPPGLEIDPPNSRRLSPIRKIRAQPTGMEVDLPPTPLVVLKGDRNTPNETSSPLAQSTSMYPTPTQSSWPLPSPLSLLPNKTFKQPAHWI
ncbi:conserved hypothetical protein [Histoplasma capsulatum var. duboisii H88]|uniref:Uncharacterized protein n=1 Tax=Ajellomyces capsulatus (strain H88) TaxID=544711 RepID=F0UR24_AJEC8|nr:conserved hypothetical protein [Histoplasma capsulatum var. duboisii H88]